MEPEIMLACYAISEDRCRGRVYSEKAPSCRGEFQRDRDRIVHSSAFRRLEYKTQVFVNHEGDMFRTRLTHTLEVSQIGRTIARALHLNEDLVEAICLAHDLGHAPFGHAGQDELNERMQNHGGFEHNFHSLRIVDCLEDKYADFSGLNLTFETREGILKHCSKANVKALNDDEDKLLKNCSRANANVLGKIGARFLQRGQASLEAQVANIADEIAYSNHDLDDGIRAGIISMDDLLESHLFSVHYEAVCKHWPALEPSRLRHEIKRRMIDALVQDLIQTSKKKIEEFSPASAEEVRSVHSTIITLSDAMRETHSALKRVLMKKLYRHYRVHRVATWTKRVIGGLFESFMQDPRLLPEHVQQKVTTQNGTEHKDKVVSDFSEHAQQQAITTVTASDKEARHICDYVAGMTDRYAILEYERIYGPTARFS